MEGMGGWVRKKERERERKRKRVDCEDTVRIIEEGGNIERWDH